MVQDSTSTSASTTANQPAQNPPQASTAPAVPDVDIFPLKIETPKWADTIEWGKLVSKTRLSFRVIFNLTS